MSNTAVLGLHGSKTPRLPGLFAVLPLGTTVECVKRYYSISTLYFCSGLELIKKEDNKRKKYIENMTICESKIIFKYRTRTIKMLKITRVVENSKRKDLNASSALIYDGSCHLIKCKVFEHRRKPRRLP